MARTSPDLAPRLSQLLATAGANIKLARLRRRLTAATMAQRVDISRKTLARAECGDPAVALGVYARILQAMQLENSLAGIAADDAPGHALQDAELKTKAGKRRRTS